MSSKVRAVVSVEATVEVHVGVWMADTSMEALMPQVKREAEQKLRHALGEGIQAKIGRMKVTLVEDV